MYEQNESLPLRQRSQVALVNNKVSSPKIVEDIVFNNYDYSSIFIYYIGKAQNKEGSLLLHTSTSSSSRKSKIDLNNLILKASNIYRYVYLILDIYDNTLITIENKHNNVVIAYRDGQPSIGSFRGGDILTSTAADVLLNARRILPRFSLGEIVRLTNERVRGKADARFKQYGSQSALDERILFGYQYSRLWKLDPDNFASTNAGSREDGIQALVSALEHPSLKADALFFLDYLSRFDPSKEVRKAASGVTREDAGKVYLYESMTKRWEVINNSLPEWIRIPGGNFLMGSSPEKDLYSLQEEQPEHTVFVSTFEMAKTPVSRGLWRLFCDAVGNCEKLEDLDDDIPITGVSWYEALRYAGWLTHAARMYDLIESDAVLTLPSEAEWEKAARGTNGLVYPWGDIFDGNLCNYRGSGLSVPVSSNMHSPGGDSPYGVADLAGNAWEWTRSLWGRGGRSPEFKYPYRADDGRENMGAPRNVRRVIRGGAWYYFDWCLRASTRNIMFPDTKHSAGGFRLVKVSRSLLGGWA